MPRHVNRSVPWSKRTQWAWPEMDTKLIQVFEQVQDIDVIMKHVENRGSCIQAGGACGVWPAKLATLFSDVYTYEPFDLNYQCLLENTDDLPNVHAMNAALFSKRKEAKTKLESQIIEYIEDIDEEKNDLQKQYLLNRKGPWQCFLLYYVAWLLDKRLVPFANLMIFRIF